MSESKPNHDHDHAHPAGGCCGPSGVKDDGPEYTDAAGEHLASALQLSFRLLGAAMVLGVLAFLAVGFRFVKPGEVAIKTVFGRVVEVVPEGLAYNWPAPIGQIELIKVGEQRVAIDDFWLFESSGEMATPLRERTVPPGGLRPGYDGALLTGDRNLIHMRLECTYTITRAYELPWDASELADHPVSAFVRAAPEVDETVQQARARAEADGADPVVRSFLDRCEPGAKLSDAVATARFASPVQPAMYYRLNMVDGAKTIKHVLCEAAIRAAGVRTADGLQRTDRTAFERDALAVAQAKLDELKSGIQVRSVKVNASSWPLATLADYDAAQSAVQQAETLKSQARGDAAKLLNATAGSEAVRRLVGDVGQPDRRSAADANTDLIGQYDAAVARGDKQAEAELLRKIDNVLVSEMTIGEARKLLTDAGAYRTNTIEAVKRRVTDFTQRLAAYEANPSFAVSRWWDEAREEILARPTAEKHYVREGKQKIVLKINRDLEIIRQTQRAFAEWLGRQRSGPGGAASE